MKSNIGEENVHNMFKPYDYPEYFGRTLQSTMIIRTKSVVKYINELFCKSRETLIGAPLENEDTDLGTHWEQRAFRNDAMTASIVRDSAFTGITFALLKDSGWYDINEQDIQPQYWGRNHCNLPLKGCAPGLPFFCDPAKKNYGCTYDGRAIGKCMIDQYSDGCGYIVEYENLRCDQDPSIRGRSDLLQKDEYKGMYFGKDSRCYESSIKLYNKPTLDPFPNVRCLKTECTYKSSGKYVDRIFINYGAEGSQGAEDNMCDVKGRREYAFGFGKKGEEDYHDVDYYAGNIRCPWDFDTFCKAKLYPDCEELNYCNGKGFCALGRCVCARGKGPDCSH